MKRPDERTVRAMNAELTRATWRKSTHSQGNGDCVEVATLSGRRIAIRDSRDAAGPALVVPAEDWRAFLARAPRFRGNASG
jgi:hypothetical protein